MQRPIRIAIALAGLHRVNRGAEVALEALGRELGAMEGLDVTLFGSGLPRAGEPYRFENVPNIPRERFERWPKLLVLRGEYAYEEFTFVTSLLTRYRPRDFDVSVTCSYPFTNWLLARRTSQGNRPAHVFVTENGDYPACHHRREFRWFTCDGLVCTNPEYFERNRNRWPSKLIPNGVDLDRFSPGKSNRNGLELPADRPVALMVSALIPSKRVAEGIRAAARVDGLHLLVCGDGPERRSLMTLGRESMPGRFRLRTFPSEQMPDVYRAADLVLHLSLDEPFGNVYTEALATGRPIVAHDCPSTRWILEESGVLVDSHDEEALVDGIRRALKASGSEETGARRELAQRRFGWRGIARSYREFFEEILTGMRGAQ